MSERTGARAASWPGAVALIALLIACSSDGGTGRTPPGGQGGQAGIASGAGAGGSLDLPGGPAPTRPPVRAGAGGDFSCGDACEERASIGVGGDTPFAVDPGRDSRVGTDADGALVIDRARSRGMELIWIPNTLEGTVSKIDTRTFAELGRYAVPGVDRSIENNGPSRTSVDSEGDVYVGAYFGNGVTKISAAGVNCPDSNGDGVVRTSNGPDDVLPIGQDDCVLWTRAVDGYSNAIAVEESPVEFEVEIGPDGAPSVERRGGARFVWVGGNTSTGIRKLDASSGETLLTVEGTQSMSLQGMAIDARGNLWMVDTGESAGLWRIATARCVDASCSATTACASECTASGCSGGCDDAVFERIDHNSISTLFGLAIDCKQRVWVGRNNPGSIAGRLDLSATPRQRLAAVTADPDAEPQATCEGIAVDAARNQVWCGGGGGGVWRIDSETLALEHVAGTGGEAWSATAVAVDRAGQVWGIPAFGDYAMVITPGAKLTDATVDKPVRGLTGAYGYSDMTGEQRRLAMGSNEPGSYRHVFSGCDRGRADSQWQALEWRADVPAGTFALISARSADSEAALANAAPIPLGQLASGDDRVALDALPRGRFLELEIKLYTAATADPGSDQCNPIPELTPRLRQATLVYECKPDPDDVRGPL